MWLVIVHHEVELWDPKYTKCKTLKYYFRYKISYKKKPKKENHISLFVKYPHCKRTIHVPPLLHINLYMYIDLPILVIVVCSFFMCLNLLFCMSVKSLIICIIFYVLFYFRKYLFCCIRTTVSDD